MNKFGLRLNAPHPALRLRRYFSDVTLPEAPATFGDAAFRVVNWGMLGNDQVGDCFWAGVAHQTMLWEKEGGVDPEMFTAADVLDDYRDGAGYSASNDPGTDPSQGFKYLQKVGIRDAKNIRHKIDGYVAVDIADIRLASWLFGSCGVGIQCPSDIEDQFDAGQKWQLAAGQKATNDGHYIAHVGVNSKGDDVFVTWGRLQGADPRWTKRWSNMAIAAFSMEMLDKAGASIAGFNADQLRADLKVMASK